MTTDLPPGWAWARLGDLGVEIRGQHTPEPGVTYDLYSVPTFPTGRPERIDGSQVKSGKRPVQPGDVLLCKINPRINRVWIVGEAEGFQQIASIEYLVLRPHEPRMARFVQQYLSSPKFRDWIRLSVEGATGSHTRAKSGPILEQAIPIAPLAEQERIVAAIEEHFSCVDAVEASLDVRIDCGAKELVRYVVARLEVTLGTSRSDRRPASRLDLRRDSKILPRAYTTGDHGWTTAARTSRQRTITE